MTDIPNIHAFLITQQNSVGFGGNADVIDLVIRNQCDALKNRIAAITGLSVVQANTISTSINGGPWSVQQRSEINQTIAVAATPQPASQAQHAASGRRACQEIRSLHNFVNIARLQTFKSPDVGILAKISTCVDILLDLECTHPSEQSMRSIIAGFALMCNTPHSQLFATLKELKVELTRRRPTNTNAANYIMNYPDTPDGLPARLRSRFDNVTDTGVSAAAVTALAPSVPLRVTSKAVSSTSQSNIMPMQFDGNSMMQQLVAMIQSAVAPKNTCNLRMLQCNGQGQGQRLPALLNQHMPETPRAITDGSVDGGDNTPPQGTSASLHGSAETPPPLSLDRIPGSNVSLNTGMTAAKQAQLMLNRLKGRTMTDDDTDGAQDGDDGDDETYTMKKPSMNTKCKAAIIHVNVNVNRNKPTTTVYTSSKITLHKFTATPTYFDTHLHGTNILATCPAEAKAKPKTKTKPKAKATAVKKPCIKGDGKRKGIEGWSWDKRMKEYPSGCTKCAWSSPGCTPSCFRARGQI